jgi:CRISPR/Cas system-associated exonuclease Cas4 (RecB family)
MPTKASKSYRFTAWSYSRLNDYLLCPLKAKLKHLLKLKEPESMVLVRGSAIHEMAANYISGKSRTLNKELKLFEQEFKLFRKVKAKVETQWAFDKNWKVCDWFAPDCWLRLVLDAHHLFQGPHGDFLHIVDHKTGKIREEQKEQLELYAIGGFLKFPSAKRVKCSFWYLDQGEEVAVEFERADLPKLQKKWAAKAAPMLKDTVFAPRPNDKCRWCHWRAELGGPCKF